MTSLFARTRSLSPQTLTTYQRYGQHPHNIDDRLHFYLAYLHEIKPADVTIQHTPTDPSNSPPDAARREDIQLLTPEGKIFMSGIVTLDHNGSLTEKIAGDEAYTNWGNGLFVRDGYTWRFFTATGEMRFFMNSSNERDEWYFAEEFDPIEGAQDVAAFLQKEYDGLGSP